MAQGAHDEAWLAGIWQRQAFDRHDLRTTTGVGFQVVYPGHATGEAGPDFRDAILALPGGGLLRGDVEIHLHTQGWRQHGHDRDPAYDRVLLHVVLMVGGATYNSRGQPVLTLELKDRLPRDAQRASRGAGHREPPAVLAGQARAKALLPNRGAGHRESPASPILTGQTRTPAAAPLASQERVRTPVASQAPLASLEPVRTPVAGQTRARGPFGGQAQVTPAASLASLLEAPSAQLTYVLAPCRQRLPKRPEADVRQQLAALALERFRAKQAVFEGELAAWDPDQVLYAGLLEALGYSRNQAPFRELARLVPLSAAQCARTAPAIEQLLLEAAGLAPASGALEAAGLCGERLAAGVWHTTGVRPDNWPARRIRQVAAILDRFGRDLLDDLISPLLGPPDAPEGRRPRAIWQSLLAELGPQRVDAVAVNVLLPFVAAYGQATCRFLLTDQAQAAFLAYPAEGGNQVTRRMQREVLAGARVASGAAGEQSLLHVWDRWCHDKLCAVCPLGTSGSAAVR